MKLPERRKGDAYGTCIKNKKDVKITICIGKAALLDDIFYQLWIGMAGDYGMGRSFRTYFKQLFMVLPEHAYFLSHVGCCFDSLSNRIIGFKGDE